MQTRLHERPAAHPASDTKHSASSIGWRTERTSVPSNQSEIESRAALLAFAWNIRDIVSSNVSMFEAFTPSQMKEFAVNMAAAFEKFTVELEAITFERDAARRELDECRVLLQERERVSLDLATSLAKAHGKIATQLQSFQIQLRALSTALVLNSSCIMSAILPEKGSHNLSPVVHGDGSFEPVKVSVSLTKFPWPVSHFCVSTSSLSQSHHRFSFVGFICLLILFEKQPV